MRLRRPDGGRSIAQDAVGRGPWGGARPRSTNPGTRTRLLDNVADSFADAFAAFVAVRLHLGAGKGRGATASATRLFTWPRIDANG